MQDQFQQEFPNDVSSPVMDALISLEGTNDVSNRTDSWAKSIPFGKSPPPEPEDGGSINESPPIPSSFGDGGFNDTPPSPSPRKARPLSYGGFSNAGLHSPNSRHQSKDRKPKQSLFPQNQSAPPLPHLPQSHFFSTSETTHHLLQNEHLQSHAESFSFSGFDSLHNQCVKPTRFGGKVLLVGHDGSLDVIALDSGTSRVAGRLTGLKGRVIEAKILTWNSRVDPFVSLRPLVAITIHGPAIPQDDDSASAPEEEDTTDSPAFNRPLSSERPVREQRPEFQTRVEVHSLRSQAHITTLFVTRPIPCSSDLRGARSYTPQPIGNLKLYSSGNYVVVASGTSGEVFIYSAFTTSSGPSFQCLGKTWARIRTRDARRYSNSSNSTDADDSRSDSGQSVTLPDSPLLSLCGRWLAVVCPPTTAKVSLQGIVPVHLIGKKTCGIDSHSPPSRPSVTCAVDSGEGESIINKVAREVTQELFKGARWLGDQGFQTWNNYWNKEPRQANSTTALRRSPPDPQPMHGFFPPTHAHETQSALASEPDLVSIIDLKKLEEAPEGRSSFPNPNATFQPPSGCSFLSFAPNGLMLLTASKKGDIHYVWDLMQTKHCRAMAFVSDYATPGQASPSSMLHIRQIARYSRMTTSSIVDVIWSIPSGEYLAIVSKKGTVHVYSLVRSAFQWPPLRRIAPSTSGASKDGLAHSEVSEEQASGPSLSSAMKLVGEKTQPILAAVRGRTPSVGVAFSAASGFGFSTATGVGSKAVAAGLSKSVGAATGTMNSFRHAGENRLHLHKSEASITQSRVSWFGSEAEPSLGILNKGYFRLYKIRKSPLSQNSTKPNSPAVGSKIMEIELPSDAQVATESDEPIVLPEEDTSKGFWSVAHNLHSHRGASKMKSPPLSKAEIEANAPFQPFHTDRRVSLMVYSAEDESKRNIPTGDWTFGEDIPAIRLNVGPTSHSDDEDDDAAVGRNSSAGRMENLISLGNVDGRVEHVVITTRRKKRQTPYATTTNDAAVEEDGFFEDDCEILDFARDRV